LVSSGHLKNGNLYKYVNASQSTVALKDYKERKIKNAGDHHQAKFGLIGGTYWLVLRNMCFGN